MVIFFIRMRLGESRGSVIISILLIASKGPARGGNLFSNYFTCSKGGELYDLMWRRGYDFAVFSTVLVRLQQVFGVDKSILGLLAACHYLGMIVGAAGVLWVLTLRLD